MASKCPNCGNKIYFSPDLGALCCDACGGIYMPEEMEAEDKQYLEDQDLIDLDSILGTDEDHEYAEFSVYTCSNCGGEIIVNSTEASTFCIYCGNPSIVFSRITRSRKPDGIIPFKVTQEEAASIIRAQLKRKSSVPRQLKNIDKDSLRGIYIPYKIVNVEYRDALFLENVTDEYQLKKYFLRAGRCDFNALSVEASSKFDDSASSLLEPYDHSEIVPFDEDYLTGFYADICDLDNEQMNRKIKNMVRERFNEQVFKSCMGRRALSIKYSMPTVIYRGSPLYVMMPVWFYTTYHEGNPLTILVNGQTGKFISSIPWTKDKLIKDTIFWGTICSLPSWLLVALSIYAGIKGVNYGFFFYPAFGFGLGGVCMMIAGLARLRTLKDKIEVMKSRATFRFVRERQE